nr:MAG TPA: hypothetical protein [Caudoviricetes sp.]
MNPVPLTMVGRGSSYRKGKNKDDMLCTHAHHLPSSDRLDEFQ